MEEKTLRVLTIDDSEDDVLLIIRELRKGGYHPEYKRIETEADMRKLLLEERWDIVLCDYKMPKFSAPQAIAVFKEFNMDIPFIVISGTIGEETAIECMRLGAHDYFMKGKLSRLCPAIDREMEDTKNRIKQKQAEEALKKSEELYHVLADNITEHVWIMDLNLKPLYLSPSAEKLYGYPLDELKALSFKRLFTEESIKIISEAFVSEFKRAFENPPPAPGTRRIMELQARHKDGHLLWTENRLHFIRDENGKPVSLMGETNDITERKLAQEMLKKSEAQYRLLADHMKDQVWLMDLNLNITYVSPSVERILEYSSEEIKKLSWDKLLTPESFKKATDFTSLKMPKAIKKTSEDLILKTLELEFITKSGEKIWGECSFSFVRDDSGKVVSILGESRNITERKQAEARLQQTLESLKKAVGTTIQVLIAALETRDPYTAGHQSQSANLACAIAGEMGLSEDTIEGIRMAGSIHDIGKLSIPAEILTKPTRLSDIEYAIIKEHPQSGYEMLKDVESPWPLAQMVYQHHERMNGTGYPRRLKGDEIILEARIMAVADVVDAMASHRPYRASLGIEAALKEIEENKGILYDEAVVDACLRLIREKGYAIT
jgi:PAS domain S-box-containing protein